MDLRHHRPNVRNLMHQIASRSCKSTSTTTLAQQRLVQFDFFSLPIEIRNEIMRLVLVPGEIHILTAKERGVKAKIQRVWDTVQAFPKSQQSLPIMPSLPGFQVLSTCKLVYGANHEMFYSSNTFFLPPGPLEETLHHFSNTLQAEHVNMITRVGVTLGIQDLTPPVFKQAQDIMSYNLQRLPSDQVGRAWGVAVQAHLSDIWQRKLAFLNSTWRLKTIKLVTDDASLMVDGSTLRETFNGIGTHGDAFQLCAKAVTALIERAKRNVQREVAARVDRDGWRALRARVKAGAYRSPP